MENEEIQKVKLPMYWLNGIPYVPSLKKNTWVGPGANFRSLSFLKNMKAKIEFVELWPVGWSPEQ